MGVNIMNGVTRGGGGGGSRGVARGGGTGTRGGKVAPVRRSDSSTRGGSGTHSIHIQEPDSRSAVHATTGTRGSQESSSKGKSKRPVEEGIRQTCGRYVITRGAKGGGVAGSHSRAARGDVMAYMAGVLRNTMRLQDIDDDEDEFDYAEGDGSHQDDVYEDGENAHGFDVGSFGDTGGKDGGNKDDGGDRPWIRRVGKKFGRGRVHRSARDILEQNLDGDWVTFSKVPHSKLKEMFEIFRTKWRWDSRDDQYIYEGFVNVVGGRFPDIMCHLRKESKNKARLDGHVICDDEDKFEITSNYPPDTVPLERWKRMCEIWNTEEWLKRSKAGRKNRKNDLSRHTGGSMGFDEHRFCLEKQKGGKVSYDLLFINTHATKETKKRLRDGEISVKDVDELEFVTQRSKESFTLFQKELEKEYGPNNDQNPNRDDFAVWKRLHPNTRGYMFGIGSSDPHFVVSGSLSSFCGSSSYDDARRSQEVQDVRTELEKEREARENLENRLEQMEKDREQEQIEREKERAEREKLQQQMEEIMKRLLDK